mmetsp:Transcript_2811/g.8581  ORF Transcript_2811/g.8581 Transcript_2811/m.8581 type:complete len:205 (-) Transcript_2811:736-1350(-)
MIAKLFDRPYVPRRVAKSVTSCSGVISARFSTSSVMMSDFRRSEQNLRDLASVMSPDWSWFRKSFGFSCTMCCIFIFCRRYSSNLRRKPMKCSARRMLPGTVSSTTSWGSAGEASSSSLPGWTAERSSRWFMRFVDRPLTRRSYSSRRRRASRALSWEILLDRVAKFPLHLFRVSFRRLTLSASMQMLSILCASSKTTTLSLAS